MANIKSAIKRIRSNEKRRVNNKYFHKSTRNAIRDLRAVDSKKEGEKRLPEVISMIDGLSKRNIIHKNKAANLKSKLSHFVAGLS
ncbi:MAG: 30S ribosomal protein S20 [Desulfobulbia bacterium]